MLDFSIDNLEFNVDSELKKDYLRQKPYDTAKADYPTIKSLDEYEKIIGKPVYNFSLAERDELMWTKFNNPSIGSVNSNSSKIKGYIDFCIRQNKVVHMQNIFDTLTKQEAKKFVSKQATEFRFISKERLKEYQDILINVQDKLIISLPFYGIRGRTVLGGTMEEIVNLQINPKSDDVKKCKLELFRNDGSSRIHYVPDELMDLIVDTYESDEYVADNGMASGRRGEVKTFKINRYKDYVLCATGTKRQDKLNKIVINSRMRRIQKYCDNKYISISNLYISGMIHMAIDIYNKNGELTKDDYIEVCRYFKYGDENPEKYYLKLKYDVELYLKGDVKNA